MAALALLRLAFHGSAGWHSKLQARLQDPVVIVYPELARMLHVSTSGLLARSLWQSRPTPIFQPSSQAHLPSSEDVRRLGEGLPHPSTLTSLYWKRRFLKQTLNPARDKLVTSAVSLISFLMAIKKLVFSGPTVCCAVPSTEGSE